MMYYGIAVNQIAEFEYHDTRSGEIVLKKEIRIIQHELTEEARRFVTLSTEPNGEFFLRLMVDPQFREAVRQNEMEMIRRR